MKNKSDPLRDKSQESSPVRDKDSDGLEKFDRKEIQEIPLDRIIPNRFQPRKTMDPESLQELIDSIRTHGVLQPIVVRRDPKKPDTYEIIVGERRFRACQTLKKETIPAVLKEADDRQMMELALIENTHRKDLNPIERAKAYQLLADTFHLTHEEVAQRVGVGRTIVTHFIRILDLPPEIQEDVGRQRITVGHAMALLAIPDSARRLMLWQRLKNEDLSVRNLRIIVDSYLHPRGVGTGKASGISAPQYRELHAGNDPTLRECASALWKKLDTQVDIRFLKIGDKLISGMIMIPVQDEEHLKRIVKKIDK